MNSRIRIVPAERKHINRIANRMREIDALECRAMGREPKAALRACHARSDRAWTALVDGQPEAMFGSIVESAITGESVVWFLGTDEVYRHGRSLLMWGPGIIARLHDSRFTLRNLVSSANTRAIRLLERWGFTVSNEEQDVNGYSFRAFKKEPA